MKFRTLLNKIGLPVQVELQSKLCPYCFSTLGEDSRATKEIGDNWVHACNRCKRRLPFDVFDVQVITCAVIGSLESGKTTFVTTLLTLMMRSGFFQGKGVTFEFVDKEGELRYQENVSDLYHMKRFPDGTKDVKERDRTPFVIRLTKPGKKGRDSLLLTVLDMPGEAFNNSDRLLKDWPNVYNAAAYIFLVDPLNLPLVQDRIKEVGRGGSVKFPVRETLEVNIISNVQRTIRERLESEANKRKYDNSQSAGTEENGGADSENQTPARPQMKENRSTKRAYSDFDAPLAVCLASCDILERLSVEYFAPEEEIDKQTYRNKDQLMRFLEDDSFIVREFFEQYAPEIIPVVEHFRQRMYFPVSSIGRDAEPGADNLITGTIRPFGVLQPLIWILYTLGFLED